MFTDPSGESAVGILIFLGITTLIGGVTGGAIAYNNGDRGWDLFCSIFVGSAFGLAAGGIIISGSAGLYGAVNGIGAKFLGVTALQGFAWGALAVDVSAFLFLPLFGINIEAIEYQTPSPITSSPPQQYTHPSLR